MVFTTYLFVFYFLPLVLLFYYAPATLGPAAGASDGRTCLVLNAFLLLASYVFYGWWNPWFILLMLGITVVNYACGRIIGRPERRPEAAVLGRRQSPSSSAWARSAFFKYFVFFEANLNQVLAWLGSRARCGCWRSPCRSASRSTRSMRSATRSTSIAARRLPSGRSSTSPATSRSSRSSSPGPIIRYNTVADQLVSRSHTWEKFASGRHALHPRLRQEDPAGQPDGPGRRRRVRRPVADHARTPGSARWPTRSRSTSTSPAIPTWPSGLGRMIGFEFLKNFDSPYHAESITDFWRRWHISLSTFLRDYLYIPLGGNRKGPRADLREPDRRHAPGRPLARRNWTFVAWGAYHGTCSPSSDSRASRAAYQRLPRPVRVAATFVLVLFSWVLFRSANLHDAMTTWGPCRARAIRVRDAALAGAALHAGDAPDHGHRGRGRRLAGAGARLEPGRHLAQGDPRAAALLRLAAGDVLPVVQPVPLLPVLGMLAVRADRACVIFVDRRLPRRDRGAGPDPDALRAPRRRAAPRARRLPPAADGPEPSRVSSRTSKQTSLVIERLRPWMQYAQLRLLADAGEKAVVGRDGWLFYRPSVPLRDERPTALRAGEFGDPLPAIRSFRDQLAGSRNLAAGGIAPNKESVYPEMLSRRAEGPGVLVCRRRVGCSTVAGPRHRGRGPLREFRRGRRQGEPIRAVRPYLARTATGRPRGPGSPPPPWRTDVLDRGWIEAVTSSTPTPGERAAHRAT